MSRYELLERIGVGSMAEIFRGIATAGAGFKKPVAIKRILPHLSEDPRFIELLIAEAKILSELQHRNIAQIYDVGLGEDGQYFLVMELVDGTDLKKIYQQLFCEHLLPVEVALHLCSELCEALEHAHTARDGAGNSLALVHRDVSPSNVLLSRAGEVKLTDFGIAKRVDEVTGYGGVRGKFAYISPEQAVNERVDARSDVFSVGILLYELVCGQRLYSGLADFDALREVREGRVRPSAANILGVAPELSAIIMKALAKDPNARFQSAGAFGEALRSYRYSLETEIADPVAEIAALVAREVDGFAESPLDIGEEVGSSTVVPCNRVAQFGRTDLSGLHELSDAAFPRPRRRKKNTQRSSSDSNDAAPRVSITITVPLSGTAGGPPGDGCFLSEKHRIASDGSALSSVCEAKRSRNLELNSFNTSPLEGWCFSSEKHRIASDGSALSSVCEAKRSRNLALNSFNTRFLEGWCFSSEKHRIASDGSVISSVCEAKRSRNLALNSFNTRFLGRVEGLAHGEMAAEASRKRIRWGLFGATLLVLVLIVLGSILSDPSPETRVENARDTKLLDTSRPGPKAILSKGKGASPTRDNPPSGGASRPPAKSATNESGARKKTKKRRSRYRGGKQRKRSHGRHGRGSSEPLRRRRP